MEKVENFLNKYWWLVILLLSIPAGWALFVPGFYGASDDLHIAWLYEMDRTLKIGQIPPRFVPDLSFGFGYPLFNFVFPLPFYLAEIFHLLGLSLVDSIKALFFLSIPSSAIFMYLLLRHFCKSSLVNLLGAVLYIYTPYRAVDIYIRGAMGEVISFVFLPLLVLSVIKLRLKSFKWVGIGAVALASLVLSHNITAFMFFPAVLLLVILQTFISDNKRSYLFKSILTVFLGFLISSYFWLPALWESSLMKYDTVFNFADHFPTLKQLLTPYWGYGASVPGPYDGMSFFLGSANLLVLIIGVAYFFLNFKKISPEKKIIASWVVSAVFISIFLMNFRSTPIWDILPLLAYFQFPWRFLILTTFLIPLFFILFDEIKFKKIFLFLVLILIIPAFFYFRPEDFLGRKDEYYLNKYIPFPALSSEYLKTQEEYLRLPKATKMRPNQIFPAVYPQEGIKNIEKQNDLSLSFEVETEKTTRLNVNKYNFPGWSARIDNVSTPVISGEPFGQVSVLIEKGKHKVQVYYAETEFRKILNFASLGGFLVSLVLALI